jgi:hypothetical protein
VITEVVTAVWFTSSRNKIDNRAGRSKTKMGKSRMSRKNAKRDAQELADEQSAVSVSVYFMGRLRS